MKKISKRSLLRFDKKLWIYYNAWVRSNHPTVKINQKLLHTFLSIQMSKFYHIFCSKKFYWISCQLYIYIIVHKLHNHSLSGRFHDMSYLNFLSPQCISQSTHLSIVINVAYSTDLNFILSIFFFKK